VGNGFDTGGELVGIRFGTAFDPTPAGRGRPMATWSRPASLVFQCLTVPNQIDPLS